MVLDFVKTKFKTISQNINNASHWKSFLLCSIKIFVFNFMMEYFLLMSKVRAAESGLLVQYYRSRMVTYSKSNSRKLQLELR